MLLTSVSVHYSCIVSFFEIIVVLLALPTKAKDIVFRFIIEYIVVAQGILACM
jgi:hypothetical protein